MFNSDKYGVNRYKELSKERGHLEDLIPRIRVIGEIVDLMRILLLQ